MQSFLDQALVWTWTFGEEEFRVEILEEARDLSVWAWTWTSIWRASVEEFREAYAEVEAELLEAVEDVGRTHFEAIDALNGEVAAVEFRLSAERLATMSEDHCHGVAAWEVYLGEEEAEEECHEVEAVVPQRLTTKTPSSILLDHHDHYQNHCFQDHRKNPYLGSGNDPKPMLHSQHQRRALSLPRYSSYRSTSTKFERKEPMFDQGRRVSGLKRIRQRNC